MHICVSVAITYTVTFTSLWPQSVTETFTCDSRFQRIAVHHGGEGSEEQFSWWCWSLWPGADWITVDQESESSTRAGGHPWGPLLVTDFCKLGFFSYWPHSLPKWHHPPKNESLDLELMGATSDSNLNDVRNILEVCIYSLIGHAELKMRVFR